MFAFVSAIRAVRWARLLFGMFICAWSVQHQERNGLLKRGRRSIHNHIRIVMFCYASDASGLAILGIRSLIFENHPNGFPNVTLIDQNRPTI